MDTTQKACCDTANVDHPCYCDNKKAEAPPCPDCDTANSEHKACYYTNFSTLGPALPDCDPTNPKHLACYICDSFRVFDPNDEDDTPITLSQACILKDGAFDSNFVPYEVNVPQYNRLMESERYVYVPPGQTIIPSDSLDFVFPEGTVFLRKFHLDTVYGDPSSRKNIEVQMQIRNTPDTWVRLTYHYRDDQTDADLVDKSTWIFEDHSTDISGAGMPYYSDTVSMIPATSLSFTLYRSAHDCGSCHYNTSANGFLTQQLNRGTQLQDLVDAGVLASVPDLAAMTAAGRITKWHSMDDSTATLDQRARSFLAGNCSQCHNHIRHSPGLTSSLEYWADIPTPEYVDTTSLAPVWPGRPDTSMAVLNILANTMPPAETGITDAVGAKLLWDWINSLDTNLAPFPFPGVFEDP
jgi:hypothetical protein